VLPFGIHQFSYKVNEYDTTETGFENMESLFNKVLINLILYDADVNWSIEIYQTIAKKSGMVEFVETLNKSFVD
jgi:hypothetical protein